MPPGSGGYGQSSQADSASLVHRFAGRVIQPSIWQFHRTHCLGLPYQESTENGERECRFCQAVSHTASSRCSVAHSAANAMQMKVKMPPWKLDARRRRIIPGRTSVTTSRPIKAWKRRSRNASRSGASNPRSRVGKSSLMNRNEPVALAAFVRQRPS